MTATFDVVRTLGNGSRDVEERVAEEVSVLAGAGLRVGVVTTGPGGVGGSLGTAALEGRCTLLAAGDPAVAGVAVLEPTGAGPAVPAGLVADTVTEAGTGWPLVVDRRAWSPGGTGTGPARPVVGVLSPGDGATWRRHRRRIVALLRQVGADGRLLVPAGSPRGRVPRGWLLRTLTAGAAVSALRETDVLLDLDGAAPTWRARALAVGVPVLGPDDLPRRLRAVLGEDRTDRRRAALGEAERLHDGALLLRRLRASGVAVPDDTPPGPAPTGPRVLMISSNGAGMGHLTRLAAMARRAAAGTEVVVLSMSQAVAVAAGQLPYDYIPSRDDLGVGSRRWNALFARRLQQALAGMGPDVVVFDGTYPYGGLYDSMPIFPRTRFIWSRRAMWKPGHGAAQLQRAGEFDLVIEPGEVAGEADRGLTTTRADAVRVGPVTLLEPADLLGAEEARRQLGLEPGRPTVLVSLGAGNLADVGTARGAVVAALRAEPDVQVCVTQPAIAGSAAAPAAGVVPVPAYPVSRYLRAFDAAVSTAGYNSFHESVAFAVPTAFVANTTHLDDQQARVSWAAANGVGVNLQPLDASSLARAVSTLLDPGQRERMAEACRAAWPGNGAEAAMRVVEAVAVGDAVPARTPT